VGNKEVELEGTEERYSAIRMYYPQSVVRDSNRIRREWEWCTE